MSAATVDAHAASLGCNFTDVLRPQGSSTPVRRAASGTVTETELVDDSPRGRTWVVTTTIRCTAERHDTTSAYKNLKCRCPEATRKAVGYEKRRSAGLIAPNQPAMMTRRRLQALASIGWTADVVAGLTGLHRVSISEIRRGGHDVTTGATAQAVLRVYRQLSETPGPSDRSRAFAARLGWERPSPVLRFLDIDEVAVRRACAGDVIPLNRGERLDAVQQLHHTGLYQRAIASLLHISPRQVSRDLADLGLTDTQEATL